MDFTPEQFEDYKKRSLSFRDETLSCIPILTDIGMLIANVFQGKDTPRYIVFCHDIVKRVRENLHFLTLFPPQKDNSVPLRLILRSVFSDLIALCYVVVNFNNSTELENFLNSNDLGAIDGKNSFAECEKEFLDLCGKKEWSGIFDSAMVDFAQVRGNILAQYGSKGNLDKSTKSTTKSIAIYFKNDPKLSPLYSLLYGPFKMLSQVEHYANENRSYSYFDINTAFFFQKFALHYKTVIQSICNDIKLHVESL